MLIIPAIDLRGGKVVRLVQGDFAKETVYQDDPVAVAQQWMAQGAQWLHVVDLDGARTGVLQHQQVIGRIIAAAAPPGTRIQVGGGLRTAQAIRELFDIGVHRVVIGTQASGDPQFRREILRRYGRRIAVGVDAKGSHIVVQGWAAASGQTLEPASGDQPDFLEAVLADGAQVLVYTEVAKDGTLEGPAVESVTRLLARIGPRAQLIAAGGIGSLEHLRQLKPLNVHGVIVGKALYEGRFTLAEALAI